MYAKKINQNALIAKILYTGLNPRLAGSIKSGGNIMRGAVAKRIRRMVFGNLAHRNTEYEMNGNTRVTIGKRREYKEAKKARRKEGK